jgi:hypothetical protein
MKCPVDGPVSTVFGFHSSRGVLMYRFTVTVVLVLVFAAGAQAQGARDVTIKANFRDGAKIHARAHFDPSVGTVVGFGKFTQANGGVQPLKIVVGTIVPGKKADLHAVVVGTVIPVVIHADAKTGRITVNKLFTTHVHTGIITFK